VGVLGFALLLTVAMSLPASANEVDDYTNMIHRALTLVQFAERGDTPSREQAITVLTQGKAAGQPEVLADLRAQPPRLVDADQRLQSLFTALQARVDTPDPSLAAQQLHQVLAKARYSGLSAGPSIPDQILAAIVSAIGWLFSRLGVGNLHLHLPVLLLLGLSLLIIGAIVVLVIRGNFSPGGREARIRGGVTAMQARLDFFQEADRLAAAGDYRGAIRMLAGGVAVKISGEHAWDRSPFTVRELFARSQRMDTLRPLLLQFEEAIYGHRPADAAAYARAAAAAAPYREAAA